MAEIQITGIKKDNGNHYNPHEAVTDYAWTNHSTGNRGLVSRAGAVKWIEEGNKAYVQRVQPRAYCYVNKSVSGTKFLQTFSDTTPSNNLLNLPEV